jgi:hypothetical protein
MKAKRCAVVDRWRWRSTVAEPRYQGGDAARIIGRKTMQYRVVLHIDKFKAFFDVERAVSGVERIDNAASFFRLQRQPSSQALENLVATKIGRLIELVARHTQCLITEL